MGAIIDFFTGFIDTIVYLVSFVFDLINELIWLITTLFKMIPVIPQVLVAFPTISAFAVSLLSVAIIFKILGRE